MGPERKDESRETGDRSRSRTADLEGDATEEYADYRRNQPDATPTEETEADREAELQPGERTKPVPREARE